MTSRPDTAQLALSDYAQRCDDGEPRLKLVSRYERATLQERWERFHDANPHVYAAFERLALEAIARLTRKGKRKRFGAKAIWEVLRWEALDTSSIALDDDDDPALNNSFTALYAREFQRRNPQHAELFETRERKA
jgi:hypothetical protein